MNGENPFEDFLKKIKEEGERLQNEDQKEKKEKKEKKQPEPERFDSNGNPVKKKRRAARGNCASGIFRKQLLLCAG